MSSVVPYRASPTRSQVHSVPLPRKPFPRKHQEFNSTGGTPTIKELLAIQSFFVMWLCTPDSNGMFDSTTSKYLPDLDTFNAKVRSLSKDEHKKGQRTFAFQAERVVPAFIRAHTETEAGLFESTREFASLTTIIKNFRMADAESTRESNHNIIQKYLIQRYGWSAFDVLQRSWWYSLMPPDTEDLFWYGEKQGFSSVLAHAQQMQDPYYRWNRPLGCITAMTHDPQDDMPMSDQSDIPPQDRLYIRTFHVASWLDATLFWELYHAPPQDLYQTTALDIKTFDSWRALLHRQQAVEHLPVPVANDHIKSQERKDLLENVNVPEFKIHQKWLQLLHMLRCTLHVLADPVVLHATRTTPSRTDDTERHPKQPPGPWSWSLQITNANVRVFSTPVPIAEYLPYEWFVLCYYDEIVGMAIVEHTVDKLEIRSVLHPLYVDVDRARGLYNQERSLTSDAWNAVKANIHQLLTKAEDRAGCVLRSRSDWQSDVASPLQFKNLHEEAWQWNAPVRLVLNQVRSGVVHWFLSMANARSLFTAHKHWLSGVLYLPELALWQSKFAPRDHASTEPRISQYRDCDDGDTWLRRSLDLWAMNRAPIHPYVLAIHLPVFLCIRLQWQVPIFGYNDTDLLKHDPVSFFESYNDTKLQVAPFVEWCVQQWNKNRKDAQESDANAEQADANVPRSLTYALDQFDMQNDVLGTYLENWFNAHAALSVLR